MQYRFESDEVLYTTESLTKVSRADIKDLKILAAKNPAKKIRLCAHPNVEDHVHEMIIVQARGTYVRPHKHLNKSESFHMIEGQLKLVFFEESGKIKDQILLSTAGGKEVFYYRLSEEWFHTVVPVSEIVVFHEITNGPFKREETIFPTWAPGIADKENTKRFINQLYKNI